MHIVDRDLQFMCAIIFVEVRCQMAATSTFICCHCFLFVLVISRVRRAEYSRDHKGFMSHAFFAFGVCVVKNVHGDALFVQASIRARAQDMMVVVITFLFFLLVN